MLGHAIFYGFSQSLRVLPLWNGIPWRCCWRCCLRQSRAAPKKQFTDRSWAAFFACQISAVFRVLRALRKQKSEPIMRVCWLDACSKGWWGVGEGQGRPRARRQGAGRASLTVTAGNSVFLPFGPRETVPIQAGLRKKNSKLFFFPALLAQPGCNRVLGQSCGSRGSW